MNKSEKDRLWTEAAKRYHLSPAHVRMARELGMNPKKLGGMANHKQERWKVPLPEFIEDLYETRFRSKRPNAGEAGRPAPAAGNPGMSTGGETGKPGEQRRAPPRQVVEAEGNIPF